MLEEARISARRLNRTCATWAGISLQAITSLLQMSRRCSVSKDSTKGILIRLFPVDISMLTSVEALALSLHSTPAQGGPGLFLVDSDGKQPVTTKHANPWITLVFPATRSSKRLILWPNQDQ